MNKFLIGATVGALVGYLTHRKIMSGLKTFKEFNKELEKMH